ncbi:MAG TPA: choice-of-anchor D domain-containing protein [Thermoanaerobaculia bacterium]
MSAAALTVSFRAVDPGDGERLSLVLGAAQLEGDRKKTPLPLQGRRVELDLRRPAESALTVSCPPGKYERLVLRIDSLALFGKGKTDPRRVAERFELAIEETIDARGGMITRVELTVSVAAFARGDDPRSAFKTAVALIGGAARATIDSSVAQTVALDPSDILGQRNVGAGLRVGRGALPNGTVVDVRRRDPDGLPDLFPGQRRVGPVIDINAGTQPAAMVEVTVPYDATAVAAAGSSPERIVVLRLDDARTAYQELRPYRVDTANRTVTVRTARLSSFFACTGGILLDLPVPFRNVVGDTLFYVPSGETTVAGRVAAANPVVTLQGAPFATSWSRGDRFAFEGVRLLDRIETRVSIRAEVEGLLAHTCDITLRRFTPPKRIATVHRFAGPTLEFLDIGTPVVSTGIVTRSRASGDDLFPQLAEWQNSLARYTGVLQEYDAADETWRSIRVVPDSFFENEAARATIALLANAGVAIPIDAAVPERIRFLSALNAFLTAGPDGPPALPAGFVRLFLDIGYRMVGPGVHALSSTLPFLQMDGDDYGVAYVAATFEGARAANGNGLQPFLDRLYGQQFEPLPLRQVPAGNLYFRHVSRAGAQEPELVAENVWCTSVVLRRNPFNGIPTILALGVRPAEVSNDGLAPASGAALLLCTRRNDGTWNVQQAAGNHPYVSADFAFDPENGAIRIVAARLDPSGFADALNCRMFLIVGDNQGLWIEEPVTWLEGPYDVQRDRGIWPRVTFDARGRLAIAFCHDTKAFVAPLDPDVPFTPPTRIPIDSGVQWLAGVLEGVGWRVRMIDWAEYADLSGSDDGNRDLAFASGMTAQSRVGFAHFAPSIAADPAGTLWMAYGKGALHLTEIDLDTLTGNGRTVDIDRTTGFYPSLALRDAGVPAIAYKDLYGTGETRPPREFKTDEWSTEHVDDLHYFRLDEGNLVPPGSPPAPLAPGHAIDFLNLQGFGARLPLTCPNITQVLLDVLGALLLNPEAVQQTVNPLLESLIMNATFDWGLIPGRSERVVRDLRILRSHPQLARHLEQVFPRPDIIEFFIRNDRTGEDIQRIDLTLFGDLFSVEDPDGRLREELNLRGMGQLPPPPPQEEEEEDDLPDERDPDIDRGRGPGRPRPPRGGGRPSRRPMPIRLRNHFAAHGWPLSADAHITVEPPNRFRGFFQLTDAAPFGTRPGAIAQVYEIYVEGTRLIVRLPARITVTDRNDNSAHVCGHEQSQWDLAGTFLAGRIGGILPQFDEELTRRAWLIAAAGIRFRKESRDPSRPQQGSVRFSATIPHFVVWGEDFAEFVLRTITPSEVGFSIAPFVSQGQLRWYQREVFGRIGEIEATINAASLPFWIHLLTFIIGPFAPALLFGGVEFAESMVEDRADEEVGGVNNFRGLGGLIQPIYAQWVRSRFPNGQPPALEAVLLRDQILTYWTREDREDVATIFLATPSQLSLVTAADGPPVRRNMLLQNAGPVPVSLDEVTLASPGGEFRIASLPTWPRVLFAGEAEIVTVEFEPDLPVGQRTNTLRARFNGGQILEAQLHGLAQSPRSLVVRPADRVAFGVINVGASRVLRVELANQGQGPLTVAGIRIDAVGANEGRFTVAPAAPLTVAPLTSSFLDVTFSPQAMTTAGNEATLVIDSDDPVRPHVEIRLIGFGAAANLLVMPAALPFSNTAVGGGFPENRRPLSLFNTGAASVTVTGNSFQLVDPVGNVSPHFQLLDNGGQPLARQDVTLRSGDQFAMQVRFRPTAAGEHFATLRLRSSTAGQPDVTVLCSGRGV